MSKVFALNEGFYSVDQSKEFKPFNPVLDDPKSRPASIFVHVQPFLVELKDDLILLDTGLGYRNAVGELIIHENIIKAGYNPNDVTKVVMSHLHFDHAGGMMMHNGNNWEPSFPNADYYIQSDELAFALSKESKSYRREPLEQLRRYTGLHLMEGDGWINSSISFEITGAHCPFHQTIKIMEDGTTFFYGGDIMPEAIQVIRRFIAKYDFDGRLAMEWRERYAKLAVEESWKCLMYHDHKHGIVEFEYFETGIRIKSSLNQYSNE
jgi:glyoxylase-like metal-dependent hydrolase (beta-lactamase superfamily II)